MLEILNADTSVQQNIHKRVWPSAQRESVVLSHIFQIDDKSWCVTNFSIEHEAAPMDPNKHVRLIANVFFMATTERSGESSSRKDVGARIVYIASVNPGGWAPAAAVQAISKREYPKFLRNFSKCALRHFEKLPLEA